MLDLREKTDGIAMCGYSRRCTVSIPTLAVTVPHQRGFYELMFGGLKARL